MKRLHTARPAKSKSPEAPDISNWLWKTLLTPRVDFFSVAASEYMNMLLFFKCSCWTQNVPYVTYFRSTLSVCAVGGFRSPLFVMSQIMLVGPHLKITFPVSTETMRTENSSLRSSTLHIRHSTRLKHSGHVRHLGTSSGSKPPASWLII